MSDGTGRNECAVCSATGGVYERYQFSIKKGLKCTDPVFSTSRFSGFAVELPVRDLSTASMP